MPSRAERDQADARRALARKIRSGRRWRRCRDAFVATNPLCCDPLSHHPDRPRPAQEVHHITPVVDDPNRAHDPDNLAPLCVRCHEAIEHLHRVGRPTRQLFAAFQQSRSRHEEQLTA